MSRSIKKGPYVAPELLKRVEEMNAKNEKKVLNCLLYTSPSPRDAHESRMPSSA